TSGSAERFTSHCTTTSVPSRQLRSGDQIRSESEAKCRVSVTASIAWPNLIFRDEVEVANQVAAPAETRTPNLQRAQCSQRLRMEGWRQWRLGGKKSLDSDRPSHGRR